MSPPSDSPRQRGLFENDEPRDREPARRAGRGKAAAGGTRGARPVHPEPPAAEEVKLAAELPELLRLGTSSWAFPGWQGLVYRDRVSESKLSKEGLCAYASHPLLRAVGLDRTHYAPLDAASFRAHAEQVPDDFRFLVKAHEALTLIRWPEHPRYGRRRGQRNELFLDPDYAARRVVAPMADGLGAKAGPLLFQFAPQSLKEAGGTAAFVERMHRFLAALPKGPSYAVEVRNRELLAAPAFAAALADTQVIPCLSVLDRLPPLDQQWAATGAGTARALLIRWMLGAGETYQSAAGRFAPFDRLAAPDPATRGQITALACHAAAAGQPIHVIVNNKAEGSAPLSVLALARAIAGQLDASA